jgi:hypothetical protein
MQVFSDKQFWKNGQLDGQKGPKDKYINKTKISELQGAEWVTSPTPHVASKRASTYGE